MQQDSYYYRRAEAELAMAERATNPEAVRAHYLLANLYLDQLSWKEPAVKERA